MERELESLQKLYLPLYYRKLRMSGLRGRILPDMFLSESRKDVSELYKASVEAYETLKQKVSGKYRDLSTIFVEARLSFVEKLTIAFIKKPYVEVSGAKIKEESGLSDRTKKIEKVHIECEVKSFLEEDSIIQTLSHEFRHLYRDFRNLLAGKDKVKSPYMEYELGDDALDDVIRYGDPEEIEAYAETLSSYAKQLKAKNKTWEEAWKLVQKHPIYMKYVEILKSLEDILNDKEFFSTLQAAKAPDIFAEKFHMDQITVGEYVTKTIPVLRGALNRFRKILKKIYK